MVMLRAAVVLDLQILTQEVKTDLTEVLQPGKSSTEPLLLFNDTLT